MATYIINFPKEDMGKSRKQSLDRPAMISAKAEYGTKELAILALKKHDPDGKGGLEMEKGRI